MTDFILDAPTEQGVAYMPSSKTQTHLTPMRVIEPLRDFCRRVGLASGRPLLDPCAADGDLVEASTRYILDAGQDGLVLPWAPFRIVYVNPPYSTEELAAFTLRCRKQRKHGAAIALLPAQKTEKLAWQRDVFPVAARICFIDGRLTFHGASNQAPFPSALALWADDPVLIDAFENAFGLLGCMR